MMRLLPFLVALLITSLAYAQSHNSEGTMDDSQKNNLEQSTLLPYKPKHKDFGATANVSGLVGNITALPRTDSRGANVFTLRYVLSDLVTLRFGLAPQLLGFRQLSTDSVGKDLIETDSTARQSSISFRPAIEFHLEGTEKLDPYVVIESELGTIGKFRARANTSITDTTGVGTVNTTITEDGGFSLGASVGLGFNYFLVKRLALGMEYGAGVRYLVTGGDRQEVTQTEPTTGVAKTERILSSTRTSNTVFNVDPTVQLTISYFF